MARLPQAGKQLWYRSDMLHVHDPHSIRVSTAPDDLSIPSTATIVDNTLHESV